MVQYLILFSSAFLAATVLPLPSEVPFAVVARDKGQILWPVIVATCGNYLGACTTYVLARMAVGRFAFAVEGDSPHVRAAEHMGTVPAPAAGRSDTKTWARAAALIRRFGAPALLLSWVPIIGDVLVGVAGAARMSFVWFSVWTIAGKAARYVAIGWALL